MSKLILAGAGVMSIIVLAAVISTWAIIYSNPVTDTTTTTTTSTTTTTTTNTSMSTITRMQERRM